MEIGDIFLYKYIFIYLFIFVVRETTLCYVQWEEISGVHFQTQ